MIYTDSVAYELTEKLLEINAIKLSPAEPFTWASGWKSPIYCDNRLTLSYPDLRSWLKNNLAEAIRQTFYDIEIVAGVATAGIPHAALVADVLNLPLIYVRSESKKHGMSNQIEGKLEAGKKVVVVEDLISTGMSSLNAVHALRNAGGVVTGLAALFTYDFDIAKQAFEKAECNYFTLTDYPTLIRYAVEKNIIPASTELLLQQWRKNPDTWTGI